MRTIKFRGKSFDNGEWVYGDYHRRADNVHTIIAMEPDKYGKVFYAVNQVNPDTIGQFTGLHDKNGQEIYEGDIVEFVNMIQGISKVVFENGCFMADAKNYETALTYRVSVHTRVIGNIHDNPELMNKKI